MARADVTEVRAGGKVRVPILANDYDPEGGALEVVDVTPWEGVDVAPGLNGQTVDVRVGTGVVSSFTLGYTVADVAGNRSSAFIDVRIVPADEVNRPPIARTDIARTTSGVGDPHRRRRQRLGPRRRHHRRRQPAQPADRRRRHGRGRRDRLHAERHVQPAPTA